MENTVKKWLAMILSVVMLISAVPTQAFAYMMEKGEKLSIVGKDGKTVTEDESWDKTFPYGTFAFERGDIVVGEGGAEVTLKLYRMGGTTGRATALISYDPVIAKMADGTGAYANAAGSKDITITVEDPLPIAQYQALGKDPEPLQPEKPVALVQGEYKGAESQPGDISLTPEIQADTYRWECLWGTQWKPINGAVNREFVVSSADYPDFDYRCIYTVGEKTYCTNSAKGTVYVPAADEVLPAMPENMQLNPDPTYTTIQTDPNDDYLGYEFLMTFADGEFVKEIKLSSPEDNLAEAEKFGAFTIIDHEGGTLYDTANTVALHVVDNDAPEPCQLGFAIKDIEADKASGDAIITVVRTGGNQTVLTIDYATKDGTAIAGKDYMATSGTLKFYADADELKIVVPLVNDGVATEERSTFTIELSNLKGDKDKLCTLKETTANVNLWNSGKTEQANLATLLQDGGAEDISAGITEGTGSVAPVGVQPITGKQVIEEAAEPMTGKIEKGDTSLLTHMYAEPITFGRPEGDALNNYWRDYRWFARNGQDYLAPWDVNAQGPDPFGEWDLGGAKDGEFKAHTFTSKVNSIKRLPVAGGREALFEELYDSMQAYCEFTAEWVSDFDWAVRGGKFTFGGARLCGESGTFVEESCDPRDVKIDGKWQLKYTPEKFLNASWSQNDEFDSVDLYTKMVTPHESVEPAKSKLRSGILHRRSLENDLRLNIVTANDYDTKGDAEELSEEFYGSIKPTITVVPGQGGVTANGKLYVGSTIKIDLTTAGGSYVTSNANPYSVCLSDSYGNVFQKCDIYDGNTATLTLAWDGMDLGRTYTVNVLMVRNQHMNLDIAPSVPRLAVKDNQQAIDTTKIAGAWSDFWKTTNAEGKPNGAKEYITLGRAEMRTYSGGSQAPVDIYTGRIREEKFYKNTYNQQGNDAVFTSNQTCYDVQYVNFNRSAEDVIVYNGRSFAGNEKIWLQQKDFALSQMQFYYYAKDYLSAESVMVSTLQRTGLYLDTNCNGKIDGKWNSTTNFFELVPVDSDPKTAEDEFVAFLQDGVDYDENMFAPVQVGKHSDGSPKYAQYFMKVTYTMNPRALKPVPGTDLTKRAQVLPAFITKLTEPASYNRLTDQQKAYRYVVSGLNTIDNKPETRSADGHIMFGSDATLASTIDIPLGGDTNPPEIHNPPAGDKTAKPYFTWEPDYKGNLLYPFAAPAPIAIEHSLAGDNIPIAEVKSVDDKGEITFVQPNGAARLNGYLGSYTANDTFALCIREQAKDTNTIAKENNVQWTTNTENGGLALLGIIIPPPPEKGHPTPESVTLGKTGTFANTEYLKVSNSPEANEESANMEGSENEYSEFDQDIAVKLPTSEIGVTDYVTIVMDEYEVGFAVGIPLGGYNSNGDAGAGGTGTGANSATSTKDKWHGPKGAYKSTGSDMKAMKDWVKAPKGGHMQAFKDSSDDYPGSDGKVTPASSHDISFALSFAFMFKYDKVENAYHFSQFKFTASATYTFSYQVRFAPVPIIYFFVTVSGAIEMETGATIERVVVEKGTPLIDTATRFNAKKVVEFQANKRVWNVTFNGKMLVECFKDAGYTQEYDTSLCAKGYVSSDGSKPVTLNLLKQVAMDIPKDKPCYVRLTMLVDTEISRLVELERMESKSYFSGVALGPKVFVEVGLGVGVEIVKIELFIKLNIEFAIMLGRYDETLNDGAGGYEPFRFNTLNFGLGLAIRLVALVFNYELDLIQYDLGFNADDKNLNANPPKSGWKHGWKALNGMYGDETEINATDSQGNTYAVRIRMPGDTSQTQNIYSNEKSKGDVDPFAYNPTGKDVPFQLSGYGSSGDAFKLADGLITGYDYKVIAANGNNYLIYTISRAKSTHAVNNTMLVMSKIKLTSTTGQPDSYGLVSPLSDTAEQKYIMLDTVSGADDGTGDLEFKAWTDAAGKIHATWISYATVEAPSEKPTVPSETVKKPLLPDGTTEMNETNYTNTEFAPVEPVEADYFITKAAYGALDTEGKAKYTEGEDFCFATAYADKAAAEVALGEAQTNYPTKSAAFTAWKNYFASLAGYVTSVQAIAAAAAKNTVVKTASFDATQSTTGFTEAKVVSGSAGAHVFLPIPADEKVTVYAKANHFTEEEKTKAKADFKAYITKTIYDPDATPIKPNDCAKSSTAQFRLMMEEGLWDAYGKGSSLCVAVDGATPKVVEVPITAGQTIDNIEAAKIGDTYYVAYTTSQKQYMTAEAKEATSGATADDHLNIRRLMLRTFTVDATSGAVTWTNADGETKALLLRTIYDYDIGTGECQDGVYNGTTFSSAYKDPTFSNMQFLNAKLGELTGTQEDFETMAEVLPEDFLLFDMNGSTYVIPQEDLKTITTQKKGRIIPFFAPGEKSSTTDSIEKGASTGRGETTIGTDGAGNLSAVYVGTVPATVNNALYLSKYDPISKTWGAGTMLAMNYMQVHEDGIKNNWTPEEREQAFLGAGKDGYIGGGLNQFKFTNLQIALGQTKTTSDVTGSALSLAADSSGMVTSPETKSEEISLFAENPADVEMKATGDGTKDTLLVLTQGSMTYLTKKEVDVPDVSTPGSTATKKQTIITPINEKTAHTMYQAGIAANPDNPAYKNRVPGVGVYAVSYGIGGQAIGESNVVFVDYDFSTGSKLKVSLGFKNTGDVGIRASGTEPALVKLMLKDTGGVTELAKWEIKSTVLAGQRVELSGVCKELTKTLQKGDIFYIEVCENKEYTGPSGFKANTLKNKDGEEVGNLMVDEKSDLSFNSSESSIKAIGIDEKGDTILQVNLFAQNRGNAPASGVFAQFSYESVGTEDLDKDGKKDMVYKPINLTGHNLETADQEVLKPFGGITEEGANNLANGIYYLTSPNPDGSSMHAGNDIWANYGRKVTGTFTVPSSFYQGSLTESFNLRVELFSAEDDTTGWDNGLVIAEHNEYNTNNNFLSMQIEHGTSYQSASRITIPMGTTMRLPLQLSTTKKVEPNIMVHEVPANKDDMHIGVSYYEHGVFANGRESGTLILAPISMGSGVIHLEDLNTNSIYAVAYTVTEAGDGLNIYNDTDMFTFKNKDGGKYNPNTKDNDWSFPTGVPTWGSSSEPNKTAEPYLRDLSKGKVGTSFTYRTQAESVKFYMDGGADISSTFPGFATRSLYANGGTEYAEVTFGENPTNLAHDVTITITETAKANVDYAEFDRMVESFGTEAPPIPSGGKNAPHIFWSRSFPERGSLTSGAVELTGYILDDETLATLTVNGKVPEIIQKNSNGFWQFTTSISSNGLLNITASDTAGNRTTRSTKIDWYIDAGPSGSSNAPNLTAALVDKDNNLLTGYLEKGETAFIKATSTTTPPPTYTASYYTKDSAGGLVKTDVIAETGGRFKAENNGFYVVTAKDSVKPQEWAATVLYMDKSDTEAPVVTLELSNTSPQSEGGKLLSWSARKQNQTSTSTIQTATINGYSVYNGTGETWAGGTFPITHAGNYELTATDTAGNEKKTSLEVKDLPIYDPSNDGFETIETRNSWGNDGLILIRTQSNFYSKLKGGKYGGVYHNAWSNEYEGTYSAKFLPKSEATLASVLADDTGWEGTTRVDNLEPGTYTVYIRDDNDKLNVKTAMVRDVVIGDESVQIKLTPEALGGGQGSGQGEAIRRTLNWEAKKDVSGKENISEIKINGITVPTTPAAELKGTLPLEYGGAYELIATSDGRAFSKTETVENVPLATRSKDALVTVERPWNATIDNGKVTVNLTTTTGGNTQKNLTGGKYDPDALSDRDAYIGKYEWRLEPAVSHANPEAEAAWLAAQLAKTEGWVTSALSNLTVGNYILIIRDAQDKENAATALTIPVAITGELVTFKATSKLAGNSSAADGAIDVEAFGGYLSQNVYQFAARPMKDKNSMGTIEAVTALLGSEYPEKDGWKQPAWQLGDLAKRVPYQSTLGGLRAGWYQVAVRTMLGVTAADMTALMDLYKTYTDAITAKDEESVIEAAKQAYETKKTKMETASNAGYTATPDLWANASTIAIYVPYPSDEPLIKENQVQIKDLEYTADGTVKATITDKKPILSLAAIKKLIEENKTHDILIESDAMLVLIPKGTLASGDDLNAMLMLNVVLPQDASGYVVQYTGKDGKTHIVPFSLVTPKKVYYIAGAVGSYGLTKNAKDFKDIPENFWGANDITFVAEHELFQGITKETFGYADTMTRGMFVTVLGRLAGVNPAEYTKKEFLDVEADSWYGGFVAWASKNNIVGGVGGNKFEPDTPVTREQMCVMLVRYLEWAKISLPTVAKDKKFEDQAQISAWAESAVELLSSVGIIKGTGQGKFLPGNDATRAEVATIYARLIKMVLGA